ncbi:MAG: hypothetical protein JHC33_02580 [Ignisphaera sp.]|nr:hypothetical protein [Ignisphaera sp.]
MAELTNYWNNSNTFDPAEAASLASTNPVYGVSLGDAAKASWLQDLLAPIGGFSGFKDLAGGLGSLGDMWMGSQALDLAKKNFDTQSGLMKANLYNTAQGFNATLGDRARYQASVYGNADPNSQAYKNAYNNYYNQYKAKDTV